MQTRPFKHKRCCEQLVASVLLLGTMSVMGCSSAPAQQDAPPVQQLAVNPLVGQFDNASKWLRADTLMVVTVDVQASMELFFKGYLVGHTDQAAAQKLVNDAKKELSALSVKRLGSDITKAKSLIIGVSDDRIHVVVKGLALKGKDAKKVGNTMLFDVQTDFPADKNVFKSMGIKAFTPDQDTTVFMLYYKPQYSAFFTGTNTTLATNKAKMAQFKASMPAKTSYMSATVVFEGEPKLQKEFTRNLEGLPMPNSGTFSVNAKRVQLELFDKQERLQTIKSAVLSQYDKAIALTNRWKSKRPQSTQEAMFELVGRHAIQHHRQSFDVSIGKSSMMYDWSIEQFPVTIGTFMNIGAGLGVFDLVSSRQSQMHYRGYRQNRLFARHVERAYWSAKRQKKAPPCDASAYKSIAATPMPKKGELLEHTFGPEWAMYGVEGTRKVYFSYAVDVKGNELTFIAEADLVEGGPKHRTIYTLKFEQTQDGSCILRRDTRVFNYGQ